MTPAVPRSAPTTGLDAGPRRLAPLLLLVASAGYICRVAPTIAGPGIMADFALTQTQLGTVFSAFLFGYTLCQVPSGWLADRVGPRALFLSMALAWTVLTLATAAVRPAVGGVATLWAVRFMFGVAAAPTYPASARTIGVNLPGRVQGTANGIVLASIGVGSAITPLMLGAATRAWGWRTALLVPAAIAAIAGLAWAWFAPRPVVTPWLASRIGWSGALSATAVLGVVAGLLWFGVTLPQPGDPFEGQARR